MWKIREITGTRAGVIEAISQEKEVPESARAYLTALINELPADANGVRICAHGQTLSSGLVNIHVSLAPLTLR